MENSKFKISELNILQSFTKSTEYVYSKTYDSIFTRVGSIDNELYILCDASGDLLDFYNLKAENTYEVLSIQDGFDMVKYIKHQ